MSYFSKNYDEISHDVEAELASLRKEVGALKRKLSRKGGYAYSASQDQLSELYDELQTWVTDAMPHLRSGARAASRTVKDNSTAIIVGTAVVGLLAALLLSRR